MKIKLTKDRRNKSSPWVIRWSEGIDFDTGKETWKSKAFKYKSDAEDFRTDLRKERTPEILHRMPDDITIADFRKEWFETRAGQVSNATVDLYRGKFDRLEDFFSPHRPLRDITRQQAEKFIVKAEYRCPGHKSKTELAESSKKQIADTCKAIFNKAIEWGYIKSNPFKDIDLPEPQEQRFHSLTADEENTIREAAPTFRQKVLYDVWLTTGARLNEILSRTWADIDFDNEQLFIGDRKGRPDLPPFRLKTRKGKNKNRLVPLAPGTIDLLTQLQSEAPEGVPYVFLTRERYELVLKRWDDIGHKDKLWKKDWLYNNALRDFKLHCRKAGIKLRGKLNIHALRKNMGQNLGNAGLPVQVAQKILGHSKTETTIKYYSQVDPHHMLQVKKVIEKRRAKTDVTQETQSRPEKKYV